MKASGVTAAVPALALSLLAVSLIALGGGCALTRKAAPLEVAHYTPERLRPSAPGVTSRQAAPGPYLRLGRVASGTGLGDRIVFGDGAYQVHYYDGRRWTERPEVYVRRALGRALFEQGGFRRAMRGDAPVLDVELLDFEELVTPALHAARVALHVVLSADRVLLEDTFAITMPVAREGFDGVVEAMARALEDSVSGVASRVAAAIPRANEADEQDNGEP